VSGTNIPSGTTIATFTNATNVTMSAAATASEAGTATLAIAGTLEVSTTRTFNDSVYTSTSKINSTAAKFKVEDIGLPIHGHAITEPCYVTARTAVQITLNTTCVNTADANKIVTIGDPTGTAPLNDEIMMDQGTQLDLDPGLVSGSDPCTNDTPEGFHISGRWRNPGSFTTNVLATQPAGTKAIGEVLFPTSVGLNYGAFVIEVPPLTGGDPDSDPHYDVVFPNVPTASALCVSATSPGIGFTIDFSATTVGIASLPQGTGRPGTSQIRAIRDNNGDAIDTTAYMREQQTTPPAGGTWSGANFERLCSLPTQPATIDFRCGTG
jgi:hypothetical protein